MGTIRDDVPVLDTVSKTLQTRCSLSTLSLNSILAIIAQKAILYHIFNTDVSLCSWLHLNINSIARAWSGTGSFFVCVCVKSTAIIALKLDTIMQC